jgi:hypothetical protein
MKKEGRPRAGPGLGRVGWGWVGPGGPLPDQPGPGQCPPPFDPPFGGTVQLFLKFASFVDIEKF